MLRGKFRFVNASGGGLAAGVDVRLPTGDAQQLLGTGGTQTKLSLIGSMSAGKFSPHVNVGYTLSAGGGDETGVAATPEVPDEVNYAIGFDAAVHERLTLSFDVVGRTLRDPGRLVPVQRQFPFTTQAGTFGFSSFEEFTQARRPVARDQCRRLPFQPAREPADLGASAGADDAQRPARQGHAGAGAGLFVLMPGGSAKPAAVIRQPARTGRRDAPCRGV